MTDAEQRALSGRIATLAEQAGLPSALLWDPASRCPQGHPNTEGTTVGDLCVSCLYHWLGPREEQVLYNLRLDELGDHHENSNWHPEWRVGRQAKNISSPANLMELVVEWQRQHPLRSWTVGAPEGFLDDFIPRLSYARVGDCEADGETPWEALALAFAEALEKGETI